MVKKTKKSAGKTEPSKKTAKSVKRDQVFPEPTVGGLISNEEGKILLAKSHKWFNKYTLPGGHVELGETLQEAVKREVKEETGLEVEVIEFLLYQEAIYPPEFYKKRHFLFFDYYCRTLPGSIVKLDKYELQEYVWVYPGAAFNLGLDSFTVKTLEKFMARR